MCEGASASRVLRKGRREIWVREELFYVKHNNYFLDHEKIADQPTTIKKAGIVGLPTTWLENRVIEDIVEHMEILLE